MKNLTTQLTAILIMVFGLMAASVLGQTKTDTPSSPRRAIYAGNETAPGTLDSTNSMCWGNTYILNYFERNQSRHLTISLDYFSSLPNRGNGFSVISGTWSLVILRNGEYSGTMYGEVSDGSIAFDDNDKEEQEIRKQIKVNLRVKGVLGDFVPIDQEINGVLKMTTQADSLQTTGTLILDY